jgi:hypothetical protein
VALLDVGFGVEQVQRAAQGDELLLEAAHRVRDLLERLVHRGDVAHDDEQLAGAELAAQHTGGAEPEHQRGPRRGDHRDHEREQRLLDGQPHAGVDGALALPSEAAVFVLLAHERDDHPQHRHRLVDDRHRLALEAAHAQHLRLDAARVVAGRAVDERHDRRRQQREHRLDPHDDHEHADERRDTLQQRRERGGDRAHGGGLAVDLEHQLARALDVVERVREPLDVPEHVTAKLEHHALVELRVDVLLGDGEAMSQRGHGEPAADGQHEQAPRPETVQAAEQRRQGLVSEHGVDQDRERPRSEQRGGRRGAHERERQHREPAVRAQVGKDPR